MDEQLRSRFAAAVNDVPNFPLPGVVFKDLQRVWQDPDLCRSVVSELANAARALNVEAVAGIESRGFILGMPLAMALGVPFVLIRKAGKLPGPVHRVSYSLEYGEATVELQDAALQPGQRVLVHDDVLATGGTAAAAGQLIEQGGAEVVAWSFLIELGFLKGRERLGGGGQIIRPLLGI